MKNWLNYFRLSDANWLVDLSIWLIIVVPLIFSTALYHPFSFGRYVWMMLVLVLLLLGLVIARLGQAHYAWWKEPAFWLATLWLLVAMMAAVGGVNPFRSWWGTVSRATGIIFFIGVWLMGGLLLMAINQKDNWVKLFRGLSWVGAFSGFYAMLQVLKIPGLYIIASQDRVSALMGNPIFFGQLLLFTIFVTLYLLMTARGGGKWWYAVSLIVQVIALFLTASRGPLLALVLAGIVWLAGTIYLYRQQTRWKFDWRYIAGGMAVLIIIFSAIVWLGPQANLSRLISISGATITARYVTWQTAWQASLARPWLGYGAENTWYAFAHFYQPGLEGISFEEAIVDRAHNFVLDQLLANGWLGLLVALILFGYLGWALWRYFLKEKQLGDLPKALLAWSLLAILMAYFIANMTAFDTVATAIYGGVLLAGAIALLSRDLSEPATLQPAWLWRLSLGLLLVGVVFLDYKYLLPAVKISHYVDAATDAYNQADYQVAAKAYAKAQGVINPYRWSFLINYPAFAHQYTSVLIDQKKYDWANSMAVDGLRVLDNIKRQEPDRVATLMEYPVLYTIMSSFDKRYEANAQQSFNELIKDFPNHGYLYINWARSLMGMGRNAEALQILNQLAARSKTTPQEFEFWRAIAYMRLKSTDQTKIIDDLRVTSEEQRAMKFHEGDQDILKFVTSYLVNLQQWQLALWYQDKIVYLSPTDVAERINLSAIYKELGDYDKAAEQARIVVKLDPSKTDATKQFLQSIGRSL